MRMKRLFILAVTLTTHLGLIHAEVPVVPYDWKPVRIGAGGFVTGMAVHPLDASVRYARTDVGNGFRWDNTTSRWVPIIVRHVETGTGLPAAVAVVPGSQGVESLSVDPSNTNIVYIAFTVDRSNDFNSSLGDLPSALYKSTDAGLTFAKTGLEIAMQANGATRNYGERIAVDPANGSVVYYGSVQDGLRRSVDGATTWAALASGGPAANANVININFDKSAGTIAVAGQIRTKVLYATVFEGDVFKSADGGETWSAISAAIDLHNCAAFSTIDSSGKLYVIRRPRYSYVDGQGVTQYYHADSNQFWRYSHAAGSWTPLAVVSAQGYPFGGYGNLSSLAIDPNNAQRMFCVSGGGSLSRSLDGGETWVNLNLGFSYANTLAWLPQITANLYRSNGGILMDRDGRLWVPQGNEGVLTVMPSANNTETEGNFPPWTIQSEGIEELVAHDVIIPPGSGDKPVLSVHDATAFFIDNPDTFTAVQANLQDQLISNGLGLAYCPNAPSYVVVSSSDVNYTGSHANYSGYSINGGRSWTPFASRPEALQCGTIAVSKRGDWSLGGDHLIVLPSTNLPPYYSHDGGQTWALGSGIPLNPNGSPSDAGMWSFSLHQRLLVADPQVVDKFYFLPLTGPLYTTIDGGMTWAAGGSTVLPIFRFHSQLATNHLVANDLWFCDGWEGASQHGLYHSIDAGQNFIRLANVENAFTLALGVGSGQAGDLPYTVYVYGKITTDPAFGVFRSTDAGATWKRIAYNPAGLFDRPSMMAASWDTFGLLYIGYNGTSFIYGKPVTPIQAWRTANGLPTDGTGIGADNYDISGNGMSNLLKYALGLPANSTSQSALPKASTATGRLAISFRRDPELTDIHYTVEASGNLASWAAIARSTAGAGTTNLGGAFSITDSGTGPRTVTIEDDADLSNNPKRFLRLNIVHGSSLPEE